MKQEDVSCGEEDESVAYVLLEEEMMLQLEL